MDTEKAQQSLNDKEKEIIETYRRLVKETGKDDWIICNPATIWTDYFVNKDELKELLTAIENEYNRAQDIFDNHFEKEERDINDYYACRESSAIMQEMGWVHGKIQEMIGEE